VLEKHRSHLQIIVGGPGVWQISEEDMKFLGIDAVFVGEGDLLFECWGYSVKFSKEIVDRLFSSGKHTNKENYKGLR